ncbi:sigma-70 family RNA polymerase sigma factor [Kribbella sp. NPDC056861]|uniref:sigma-70 family RNA polymerase sigma factor n=1 Tax=Kribbella sp. NPDC056861 TaxID=3154857 RepID=UPI00342470DD
MSIPAAIGPPKQLAVVMEQVADGDHDAFAVVYAATVSRAFGIALRVLRNQALAEEIAQDVMVELWRTAPRYDADRGSVETWVTTIAHRRAVDRVRRERAAKDRDGDHAVSAAAGASFDLTAETVLRGSEIEQVRGCLLDLTDLQRQALVLAFYEGHTYQEVADLLSVKLPTVKARIRDGLLRLRNGLTTAGIA